MEIYIGWSLNYFEEYINNYTDIFSTNGYSYTTITFKTGHQISFVVKQVLILLINHTLSLSDLSNIINSEYKPRRQKPYHRVSDQVKPISVCSAKRTSGHLKFFYEV